MKSIFLHQMEAPHHELIQSPPLQEPAGLASGIQRFAFRQGQGVIITQATDHQWCQSILPAAKKLDYFNMGDGCRWQILLESPCGGYFFSACHQPAELFSEQSQTPGAAPTGLLAARS